MKLKPHPRLYVGRERLEGLRMRPPRAPLAAAWDAVAERAEAFVRSSAVEFDPGRHNSLLVRAFGMQDRVMTLLVRWFQTGEVRHRDAVVRHVREMAGWKYWSWITWRKRNPDPKAIYDLSYGVNSATLALAYDWLCCDLTPAEKKLFVETARRRALGPYVHHVTNKQWPEWYSFSNNWNAVCAGGGGLLALAMYEELPEAKAALAIAERTIPRFIDELKRAGGGWNEGVGYWNFGMRYAFMYLLSHESATGRKHPLLGRPEVSKTLSFPLDFCPHGVPCGFGDSNRFGPQPFHYAAAVRLGRPEIVRALDSLAEARQVQAPRDRQPASGAAELLVLYPRSLPGTSARKGPRRKSRPAEPRVKLYRGLEWGRIADRWPDPNIYLAVRGGTTRVPHGHRDLMSFHCVVAGEALVTNLSVGEYLDTTFGPRRDEIFEVTPASKNMIFINGVGVAKGSRVKTSVVKLPGAEGLRIDATGAMGEMRDGPAATFCGRLFLMLKRRAFLILDRVELPHPGRVETRMHTYAKVRAGSKGALLAGERSALRVAYACDVPSELYLASTAATKPNECCTQLRWCARDLTTAVTVATLLAPGRSPARVTLTERRGKIVVEAEGRGFRARVRVSARLLA